MKFIIPLLAIIALSNCKLPTTTPYPIPEETKVLVKNFEAKFNALLAAKNYDGLLEYLYENMYFSKGRWMRNGRIPFIDMLKNGYLETFEGFDANIVPIIVFTAAGGIVVNRRNGGNEQLSYNLRKQNGTEFGYSLDTLWLD